MPLLRSYLDLEWMPTDASREILPRPQLPLYSHLKCSPAKTSVEDRSRTLETEAVRLAL